MKPPSSEVARARPLLGTLVEITIGAGEAGHAIDAAFEEIALIHRLMSFHETASDVSRLNHSAPGECVEIDVRTFQVLTAALCFSRESAGAFDVTIGAQLVAAGLLPDEGFHSEDDCCHRDLVLLPENRVMRRRAALIDLGGIAKGYAVDRAVDVLLRCGVRNAIVNAGGDLRTFGEPRPLHVRQPADASKCFLLGRIANIAVASSSGLYARNGEAEPLVDPRQRALRRWQRTVTVMASSCVVADALTKVVRLVPRRAQGMLTRYGAQALMADHRGVRVLCESNRDPYGPHWLQ
jgi:thiamine biosynthesis lipoprotein